MTVRPLLQCKKEYQEWNKIYSRITKTLAILFDSAVEFEWQKIRPKIDERVAYFYFLQNLIHYSVEIDIYYSPKFTLYSTCQIIFSVPTIFSLSSTGKEHYPNNNLSSEFVSDSAPIYLWIEPPTITAIPYVKRKSFILLSKITTSTSSLLYFCFQLPFKLIYTAVIVPPCCTWKE